MNSTQASIILELSPGASQDEVKAAFRRLSLKYHPDKNSDKTAEDKFKAVNTAYQLLIEIAPKERIRDVGEARADRVRQATGDGPIGREAATEFNRENASAKPVDNGLFGVFNFGGDLFGQIVDAAKNKSKNQK